MKATILCVFALLASTCCAQDNFRDLPKDWDHFLRAEELLHQLSKAGFTSGELRFPGVSGSAPTHKEIAEEVLWIIERVRATPDRIGLELRSLKSMPFNSDRRKAETTLLNDIERYSSMDWSPLKKLIASYEKELAELGLDVERLKVEVAGFGKQFGDYARNMRVLLESYRQEEQPAKFPDVPENHELYEVLAYLKKHGVFVGYADQRHGVLPRVEIAEFVGDSLLSLERFNPALDQFQPTSPRPTATFSQIQTLRSRAERAERVPRIMAQILSEFNREFLILGYDTAHLRQKAAILSDVFATHYRLCLEAVRPYQSFPHAPREHWASEAVDELKFLGLLKGYPDGRFTGR